MSNHGVLPDFGYSRMGLPITSLARKAILGHKFSACFRDPAQASAIKLAVLKHRVSSSPTEYEKQNLTLCLNKQSQPQA
jgi:hypothetical protein